MALGDPEYFSQSGVAENRLVGGSGNDILRGEVVESLADGLDRGLLNGGSARISFGSSAPTRSSSPRRSPARGWWCAWPARPIMTGGRATSSCEPARRRPGRGAGEYPDSG